MVGAKGTLSCNSGNMGTSPSDSETFVLDGYGSGVEASGHVALHDSGDAAAVRISARASGSVNISYIRGISAVKDNALIDLLSSLMSFGASQNATYADISRFCLSHDNHITQVFATRNNQLPLTSASERNNSGNGTGTTGRSRNAVSDFTLIDTGLYCSGTLGNDAGNEWSTGGELRENVGLIDTLNKTSIFHNDYGS